MKDCKSLSFKHVLLIGAGQLGSRYLQGLAGVSHALRITVVDPSASSLELARQRLAEVSLAAAHEVRFSTSLDAAPKQLDLALVVTPAHCRAEVVSAICAQHEVSAWILEKLLAQSSQQVDEIEKTLAGHSRVWVNTPKRIMLWHQAIKDQLISNAKYVFRVRVSGGNWGMACNTIHYIDLVSWWSGASVYGVDSKRLQTWRPSKRYGFQEIFGSLTVEFFNGCRLEINCNQSDAPLQIEVETPEGIWLIEEASGRAVGPFGQVIAGLICLQSDLTAPLVEQILTAGHCGLPSLAVSAAQHRPLLDALLQHWNFDQFRQDLSVPIT